MDLTLYQLDWAIFAAKPTLRKGLTDHFESKDSEEVGLLMAWLWDHIPTGAR